MELTTSIKIRMDLPKSSVLLVPRSNKIIVLISEFGTFSNLDFLKYLPANNWEVETIMNKYLPLFGNVALCSILLSVGTAYSNETVLTPVPQNRIFISTTVSKNFVPILFESKDVTGKCDIALWVDAELSAVYPPADSLSLALAPGKHKLRLTYAPVPKDEKARQKVRDEKGKYCLKDKPQETGFLKEIELERDKPQKINLRINQGYLFRIAPIEDTK